MRKIAQTGGGEDNCIEGEDERKKGEGEEMRRKLPGVSNIK